MTKSHQVKEAADHLPLLQVGLAVQCGRLNVAQVVRVARAQQQHISWENFVAAQFDEVPHLHLLPKLLHVTSICPNRHQPQKERFSQANKLKYGVTEHDLWFTQTLDAVRYTALLFLNRINKCNNKTRANGSTLAKEYH